MPSKSIRFDEEGNPIQKEESVLDIKDVDGGEGEPVRRRQGVRKEGDGKASRRDEEGCGGQRGVGQRERKAACA